MITNNTGNSENFDNYKFAPSEFYLTKTTFEHSNNEVYVDFYLHGRKISFKDKVRLTLCTIDAWIVFFSREYPDRTVKIIFSADTEYKNTTLWFYTLREEEDFIGDIEEYPAPLAYVVVNE